MKIIVSLSSGLFPSGFPIKTLYVPLLFPIQFTYSAHLILYLITQTILDEEYRSLSSSLCSFLHSLFTSSLLGPDVFLSLLFLNTLSLCSSLSVWSQVSHLFCIFMFWYCPAFCSQYMSIYVVFSAFTSRPVSLLEIKKVSVFNFEVCVFSSNKLTSPA